MDDLSVKSIDPHGTRWRNDETADYMRAGLDVLLTTSRPMTAVEQELVTRGPE